MFAQRLSLFKVKLQPAYRQTWPTDWTRRSVCVKLMLRLTGCNGGTNEMHQRHMFFGTLATSKIFSRSPFSSLYHVGRTKKKEKTLFSMMLLPDWPICGCGLLWRLKFEHFCACTSFSDLSRMFFFVFWRVLFGRDGSLCSRAMFFGYATAVELMHGVRFLLRATEAS